MIFRHFLTRRKIEPVNVSFIIENQEKKKRKLAVSLLFRNNVMIISIQRAEIDNFVVDDESPAFVNSVDGDFRVQVLGDVDGSEFAEIETGSGGGGPANGGCLHCGVFGTGDVAVCRFKRCVAVFVAVDGKVVVAALEKIFNEKNK